MSLIARLVHLVRDAAGRDPEPSGGGEEHLAAAALLVHVARVDGRVTAAETEALAGVLGRSFGLSRAEAGDLVARADLFDLETDDVGTLVEMLGHEHGLDREGLLAMAFRVAAADGALGEFEDDLLWRTGHLLGLDDTTIAVTRAAQLAAAGA